MRKNLYFEQNAVALVGEAALVWSIPDHNLQ